VPLIGHTIFEVYDDLTQFLHIAILEGLLEARLDDGDLLFIAEDIGVGLDKHRLVKGLAKLLLSLVDLFGDLVFDLGHGLLDEHIGAIALLGVFIVYQGIVECVHVTGGLPGLRVHEDGSIEAHDILMELHHALPPVFLYVLLQLYTILAIVIYRPEAVIYL
jgi:hypothetical protein